MGKENDEHFFTDSPGFEGKRDKPQLLQELAQLRRRVAELGQLVAAHKSLEKDLEESEERLRVVIQNMPVMMDALDCQGNIIVWNRECEEVTGYPASEIIGNPHALELLYPDPALRKQLTEELKSLNYDFRDCEWELTCKNGTLKTISWSNMSHQFPIPGWYTWAIGIDVTRHKQTERRLLERRNELEMLNRATQELAASLDLDLVLMTVLTEVQRLLDVTACSVWLLEPETNDLVCRQATGAQSECVRGWRVAPGTGIVGWTARTGEGLIIPDALDDPRYFHGVAQQTGLKLRSLLSVPLRAKQQIIGVLEVVDNTTDRFSATDLEVLESLAATAAIAIENAQLYEQARQDSKIKDALLNEINHRVKNNLTSIMGILSLEMQQPPQKTSDFQERLRNLQCRIQGMATVHDMLSSTQWAPLPLDRLITEVIYTAVGSSPLRSKIHVTVFPLSPPLLIPSEQATDLGIIINELTTDSIKYAFEGRDHGQITVQLTPNEEDRKQVTLQYRDDGPGWPDDVLQGKRSGVGLRLIQAISRSPACSHLILQNNDGAMATLTFNVAPSEDPADKPEHPVNFELGSE